MNNQNNNARGPDVELVIARGISKQPTRDGQKHLTKLFFDTDSIVKLVEQIQIAINSGEDGVSLTLLEGNGKKGPYGMVSFKGLEKRAESEQPQQQQKAYAPKPGAAPATTGGYKPKSPGYKSGYGK